jgi:hypothetical protein
MQASNGQSDEKYGHHSPNGFAGCRSAAKRPALHQINARFLFDVSSVMGAEYDNADGPGISHCVLWYPRG